MSQFLRGLLFSVSRKSAKQAFGSLSKSRDLRTVKICTVSFRDARRKELNHRVLKNDVRFTSSKNSYKYVPRDAFAGRSLWKSVMFILIFGSVFSTVMIYLRRKKSKLLEERRQRVLGKAKIGGRFELVDENNKIRKSEDFLGKWLLIYFGFTHCPDICPDEMEKLAKVIDKLEKIKGEKEIVPIFISVDPERDTPSIVGKYVKEFSDKVIGLTGTVEQIAAVCKAYRVYFSPGPKDKDSDYIVDHSIIMYLIDPDGNFMDYFGQRSSADQIVASVKFNWYKYDELNKKGFFFF